jgi:hypothetical protein
VTDVVPSPTSSSWTLEMLTKTLAAALSKARWVMEPHRSPFWPPSCYVRPNSLSPRRFTPRLSSRVNLANWSRSCDKTFELSVVRAIACKSLRKASGSWKAGGKLSDSYLDEGFIMDKKVGVNQPKRLENANREP